MAARAMLPSRGNRTGPPLSEIECYNCQSKGHYRAGLPQAEVPQQGHDGQSRSEEQRPGRAEASPPHRTGRAAPAGRDDSSSDEGPARRPERAADERAWHGARFQPQPPPHSSDEDDEHALQMRASGRSRCADEEGETPAHPGKRSRALAAPEEAS